MLGGRPLPAASNLRRVFLLATFVLLVALLVVFAVLRGQNNARQWVKLLAPYRSADLAREVRRRWPNVRVLLTTGYAGSTLKGAEAEVAVLSKPYEMKTLDTALSAALGKPA